MDNSSKIESFFITHPTKIAMNIPPKGSIIWLVKKSVKSKKFLPNNLNSDNKLNDKALNKPKLQAIVPSIKAAVFLLNFKDSTSQATLGSRREIEELSAAILNKTKNTIPNNAPKGILLNAKGRVMNTNPGPPEGDKPFANTMGKIAIPANKATKVSKEATEKAVYIIDCLEGI